MFHQLIAQRNATIVTLYNLGLSVSFIAEQFGVTERRVKVVVRRSQAQ